MIICDFKYLENIICWNLCRAVAAVFFLLILIVIGGCRQQSFEGHGSVDVFSKYLDSHIPLLMNQYGVPGVSVALVCGGKLAWSSAYGYADLEHSRKMSVDAVFHVESISKSLTAWGVIRLVEKGLINLDAPVQQYLSNWKLPKMEFPEQQITIRKLLSHNAGMPLGTIGKKMEYAPQSNMPSLQDTLFHEARIFRSPGSGFSYSNTGFNLLELLIEKVTGQNFAEYMADEVLTPLGMYNSSFVWNEALTPSIPTGYDLQGKPVMLYVYPVKASGGLFASVEDIARFVAAGMTGSFYTDHNVLREEGIRSLYTPQVDIPGIFGIVADSYGFGYFIENLADGRHAVWHGGQGHGWMSHFHAVPESGVGIVILTNSQRSWPVFAQMLKDWAGWSGLGSVKMGRIIYGIVVLRLIIVIVVLISLWQAYRLIQGLYKGDRRWTLLSRNSRKILLQLALAAGVIAVLVWSASQPYLIVSSIFPATANWAGVSFFVLSVIMILSALFPSVED